MVMPDLQQAKWSRQLFSQPRMSNWFLLEHKTAEQSTALLRSQVIKHTVEQELSHQQLIGAVHRTWTSTNHTRAPNYTKQRLCFQLTLLRAVMWGLLAGNKSNTDSCIYNINIKQNNYLHQNGNNYVQMMNSIVSSLLYKWMAIRCLGLQ